MKSIKKYKYVKKIQRKIFLEDDLISNDFYWFRFVT